MKGIHPMFILASALDPRTKHLFFMKTLQEKEYVWNDIINGMLGMFNPSDGDIDDDSTMMSDDNNAGWFSQMSGMFYEEGKHLNVCRNDIVNEGSKTPEETNDNNDDDFEFADCNYFGEGNGEETNNIGGGDLVNILKQEVLAYKAEEGLSLFKNKNKGEYHDPLEWWKKRQGCYPHLAALARIILSVPATSAPSERIFSVATNIVSKKRARMDSTLAGDLIFLKQNLEWFQRRKEEKERE